MTRNKAWLLAPVVFILTFAVFLPALQNDFVNWDDDLLFLNNPYYRGLGLEQLRWMWTNHIQLHYTPLTWMTLGLDYTIWGMDPTGYHLTNILFHAANAVLVYFLALALLGRTLGTNHRIPIGALFVALVFAIHPLRVESVAWATERRDVVAAFFYLLAILAYLRAGSQRKFYWVCFGFFVLALLAKSVAATLPGVLLILDVYPLGRLGPRRWFITCVWLEKIPFAALAVISGALAVYFGRLDRSTATLAAVGWPARAGACVYGLAFYLWKTIVPIHLAPFYMQTAHRTDPRAWPFQLSAAVVVAAILICFQLRRRFPALPAAGLAYVVTLFPVLGLFQNGAQIAADRYSYLACLGWTLVAGASLTMLCERFGAVLPITTAAALICILGVLTWRQVETWKDSETLWTHAIAIEPSHIAFNSLGADRMAKSDIPGAVENFRMSVQMNPSYAKAHQNLGVALLNLGDWDAAIREFQSTLRLDPAMAPSQTGWGYALMMEGRNAEAIAHFEAALKIDPGNEAAQRNLNRAMQ